MLGDLKGGAMKVGQALPVIEAAVPERYTEPYREVLTKLQTNAPPLPAAKLHRVLDAQLGTTWRDRFVSFDDEPVAAASIGQVHKAIWSDGREVAVKIQYPGADEALRADLKTLKRLVSVVQQLAPRARPGVMDRGTGRRSTVSFSTTRHSTCLGTGRLEISGPMVLAPLRCAP